MNIDLNGIVIVLQDIQRPDGQLHSLGTAVWSGCFSGYLIAGISIELVQQSDDPVCGFFGWRAGAKSCHKSFRRGCKPLITVKRNIRAGDAGKIHIGCIVTFVQGIHDRSHVAATVKIVPASCQHHNQQKQTGQRIFEFHKQPPLSCNTAHFIIILWVMWIKYHQFT